MHNSFKLPGEYREERRLRWSNGRLLLALAFAVASGCGPSGPALQTVRGTVKVNGKPADQAVVFLHRKQRSDPLEPVPYGVAGADGAFEIKTTFDDKGVQTGDYAITIFVPDLSKPEDGNGQRPDLLNGAYQSPADSTLSFTVKEGENTIPVLDVKPGPPIATRPPNPNAK